MSAMSSIVQWSRRSPSARISVDAMTRAPPESSSILPRMHAESDDGRDRAEDRADAVLEAVRDRGQLHAGAHADEDRSDDERDERVELEPRNEDDQADDGTRAYRAAGPCYVSSGHVADVTGAWWLEPGSMAQIVIIRRAAPATRHRSAARPSRMTTASLWSATVGHTCHGMRVQREPTGDSCARAVSSGRCSSLCPSGLTSRRLHQRRAGCGTLGRHRLVSEIEAEPIRRRAC